MPRERSAAFAPGRVNLIGEHTDYNEGLALPFAIAEGITVRTERLPRSGGEERIEASAVDLGESDEFPLGHPEGAHGWRAFVRGTAAELGRARFPLVGARLQFGGDVPQGAGLSSSAALEVALCLALLELGSEPGERAPLERIDRTEIAQLCARVERDWVGARTGLLDQLASLYGTDERALCIDFRSLRVDPVPLQLGDWRLVVLDSGERHSLASSGYNERREQCARACELLGVSSLRDADEDAARGLPEPLGRRVAHVLGENRRVLQAVEALQADDLEAVGELLDASHASLRDDYEISTPAVEAAVSRLRAAGASGARLVGGGFGGSVLGLFAPGREPPSGAREVRPGPGARMLAE
ncbi:MAG TPA: galactokinase family protein [Solirubrobacteraceae bacterium]|nr:galactokinase family protein [Solirubrobacteraceae bacterium]